LLMDLNKLFNVENISMNKLFNIENISMNFLVQLTIM
jgi:hypothetical protein